MDLCSTLTKSSSGGCRANLTTICTVLSRAPSETPVNAATEDRFVESCETTTRSGRCRVECDFFDAISTKENDRHDQQQATN